MRIRPVLLAFACLSVFAGSAVPAHAQTSARGKFGRQTPLCESPGASLCADLYDSSEYEYVGHDEPSVLFKSDVAGSGNDVTYTITLPREPAQFPSNTGAGSTWNFQLRPTFWFGMTMCDSESSPEFTKTCTPDSDANDLVGLDPTKPDYIGRHPGNAYMELQFYGPGYVPQFEGFGCTGTQYCAAMTIDSRTLNQNTGVENTDACDDYVLGGGEPINWAYFTHDGVSQAPASPLSTGTLEHPNFAAVNPDTTKDLLMSPGDGIVLHMHDTPAGFRVDMTDLTSGETGSMTASIASVTSSTRPAPAPARKRRTRSTRSTPPATRAGTPGRRTRTTSQCPMRSVTSRIARCSTRPARTAPSPASSTRTSPTRTTATSSASPPPTRCS
jgi:hypothetical protein